MIYVKIPGRRGRKSKAMLKYEQAVIDYDEEAMAEAFKELSPEQQKAYMNAVVVCAD